MDKNFVAKFLKGSASTTVGTLISIALQFLSITFMARHTPELVLGFYFLILAVANGGKIFASMGLDLTLVQFLVSENDETKEESFAAIIWFRFIILAVIAFVTFFFGELLLGVFDAGIQEYVWTIPVLIALMSFRELFFYIMQGLEKYRHYAYVQAVSAVLKLVLVLVFIDSLTLMTLIWIEFAMLGLSLIFQLFLIPFRKLSSPNFLFKWAILPKIFGFGLPLYANSIFTYISNFGAVFIVGLFLSPVSIAAYEIARKIPEGFMRLFTSFRVVYFPSLSSLFAKGDIKNAEKLMNKSLILIAAGTFLIVLIALLFSHEIISLFSEKYLDVQAAFVLLMFAVSTHLLASTMGYSLVSAGYPERSTFVNILAMSIELGLSFLFIPKVGYIGAAYSYIVMTILSQILCFYFLTRSNVRLNLIDYLKPYVFLLLIAGVYLSFANQFIVFRVFLLAGYIALCISFIPDCYGAVAYLWKMLDSINWQRKAKLEMHPDD